MPVNNRNVGLIEGKLRPCPKTPNCVSTQSEDKKHRIEPISYNISIEEAKKKIVEIINSISRMNTIYITVRLGKWNEFGIKSWKDLINYSFNIK